MERNGNQPDLKAKELSLEELASVAGGELTEQEKEKYWEQTRRIKMLLRLEDFIELEPEGERKDYIISIWHECPPLIPGRGIEEWQP